jgi:hypothetical protein
LKELLDQFPHNLLPVQSLIMFFGGAATFIALLVEPLGRVVGWGACTWLTEHRSALGHALTNAAATAGAKERRV